MALDFAAMLKAERASQHAKDTTLEPPTPESVEPERDVPIAFPPFALAPRCPVSLEDYRIGSGSLRSVFYIPDFFSQEEETAMLEQVYAVPASRWTQLRARRLQQWGGDPAAATSEPLPPWLQSLVYSLAEAKVTMDSAPDHVLINEYLPGQGIMPHRDGPNYAPYVITASLGSDAILTFLPHIATNDLGVVDNTATLSMVLQRRSLVIFCEQAYEEQLHTIAAVHREIVGAAGPVPQKCHSLVHFRPGEVIHRQTRVSLTIRHVRRRAGCHDL